MADRYQGLARSEITYKGVFSYEWLYKAMYYWLGQNGYKSSQDGSDRVEDFYFENIWTGGSLKEVWYWWRVKKKDSDDFQFYIKIDAHILGQGKKEIIVEGNKFKTNEQEVSIFVESYLMVGEKFDLNQHWLTRMFKYRFLNSMYQDRIQQKQEDLRGKTHEFMNIIKQFFEEMQNKGVPPPFHAPGGIPQLK